MRAHSIRTSLLSASAVMLFLGACSSGESDISGGPAPAPAPAPAPTPTPTPTSFNVTRCLNQQVGVGVSVTNLIIPDTLTLDLTRPSGFPNGRDLEDPVVDLTLAVILLDLTRHSAATFANLPVNPDMNDVPLRDSFPYFAPANGTPPLPGAGGTNYNFRTDPPSAYTRVDRMGMPAVATALISSSQKVPYNDINPVQDATGAFVPENSRDAHRAHQPVGRRPPAAEPQSLRRASLIAARRKPG